MAKKSKIARNEQRRVIVERYAERSVSSSRRLSLTPTEPTSLGKPLVWACRSSLVTPLRFEFAVAMRSTVGLVGS